jgi:hypothetical protein
VTSLNPIIKNNNGGDKEELKVTYVPAGSQSMGDSGTQSSSWVLLPSIT